MNLTHHFLLSMPSLSRSYFDKSITYMVEHNDDGALGFVINKASPLRLGDILEQLDIECSDPACRRIKVLEGGPVEPQRGFLLHTTLPDQNDPADDNLLTRHGIGLSASLDMLTEIAASRGPEHYLMLLGYAGWSGGQLESEIAANAWLTCEADSNLVFESDPDVKFNMAAASLGIDFSMITSEPGHA